MSEVPIYLRRGNGICTKIMVSLTTPVSAFYQIASSVLKMDLSVILMYCQGVGLDRDNSETSLFQLQIRPNSIVDVLEIDGQKPAEITILVEFCSNVSQLCINELEPFTNIRQRIAEILSLEDSSFQLHVGSVKIQDQETVTPFDLNFKENQLLIVRLNRINIDYIRQVESVASSSDQKEKSIKPYNFDVQNEKQEKKWGLKKNGSYTSSLKNINEFDVGYKYIKKSAIEPTRHLNEFLTPKPSKNLHEITDMKETMSFGSLESTRKDDFSVSLNNVEKTKYYKISCLPECRGGDIRQKLARLERVEASQMRIQQIDDEDQMGQLLDWADQEGGPSLLFRVLNKIE